MAPKASQKGKAAKGKGDAAQGDLRLTRARFGLGLGNRERTGPLRYLVASDAHEGGRTEIKPTSEWASGDVPFFVCFLTAGLVPPLSEFCQAILEEYGLVIQQLHPNAVLVMAIFAHLCEGFVGVMPSVALFRHFYIPRVDTRGVISGGITWCLRSGRSTEFPRGTFKSKWDEWRGSWCYVHVDPVLAFYEDPVAAVVAVDSWKDLDPRDKDLRLAVARIQALRSRGLTSNMVAADFLWRRLAPLQRRSHPAWAFEGPSDRTRLWPGARYNLSVAQHGELMRQLFGPIAAEELPAGVVPLCVNSKRDCLLELMPACNARGVEDSWRAPAEDTLDKLLSALRAPSSGDSPPPEREPMARESEGEEAGAEEGDSERESDPGKAPPAPRRRPAARRRLQTLAEKEARQGGGSSRGGPPSRRVAAMATAVASTATATPAPAAPTSPPRAGDDSDEEDLEPLIQRQARTRAAARDAATGAAQDQPRPETAASPNPAPGQATRGPFLKRKTWVVEEEGEEER